MRWSKDYRQTAAWRKDREWCFQRYGRRCLKCGSTENLTIDHIISVFTDRSLIAKRSNMQPLCDTDNKSKGIKTIDYRPFYWRGYYAMIKLIKKLGVLILVVVAMRFVYIDYSRGPIDTSIMYQVWGECVEAVDKIREQLEASPKTSSYL